MNGRLAILGFVVIVLGILASMSLYVVRQDSQALVFRFGEIIRTVNAPGGEEQAGLHWKYPWENAILFDKRTLNLDGEPQELVLSGQQRLEVDTYARYRIINPGQFFQSVGNETTAESRLSSIMNSAVRNILAEATQSDVVSTRRVELMRLISDIVREQARPLGIEVIDVRLRAADLPPTIQENVYQRMQSERQQEAAAIRGEGEQQYRTVTAEADRQVTELRADAERQAQVIRGEGDQEAIRTYANAFSVDKEFYAFYRSLEAYRNSLATSDTMLLMSPDSEFFRYFKELPSGARAVQAD